MSSTPIRVTFLCLGNICRSPLAEGICRAHVDAMGVADLFDIDSAGTSAYHAGDAPDPGSIRVASAHGLDISRQRSRQLVARDLSERDFIVAMDTSNRRNALRLGAFPDDRLVQMLDFGSAEAGRDVPDPWGGGRDGFSVVYQLIDEAMPGFIEYAKELGPRNR